VCIASTGGFSVFVWFCPARHIVLYCVLSAVLVVLLLSLFFVFVVVVVVVVVVGGGGGGGKNGLSIEFNIQWGSSQWW
jgi:hypothetical protein